MRHESSGNRFVGVSVLACLFTVILVGSTYNYTTSAYRQADRAALHRITELEVSAETTTSRIAQLEQSLRSGLKLEKWVDETSNRMNKLESSRQAVSSRIDTELQSKIAQLERSIQGVRSSLNTAEQTARVPTSKEAQLDQTAQVMSSEKTKVIPVGKPTGQVGEQCAEEGYGCFCTGKVYMATSPQATSRLVHPNKVEGRITCAIGKLSGGNGNDPAFGVQKKCFCEGIIYQNDPTGSTPLYPRNIEQLPSQLRAIGLSVFNSTALLSKAIEHMAEPREIRFSSTSEKTLWMVEGKKDDSLIRTNTLLVDYGLEGMKESDGNLMVDIGANIGFVTIVSALLHPRLRICSFEPVTIAKFRGPTHSCKR